MRYSIRTTAEHPFWVWGKGWTEAAALLGEGEREGSTACAVAGAPLQRVN
jgi:hypothetical protein